MATVNQNRIRAYTRWPCNRAARIEAAKVDISAGCFFGRVGMEIPRDILERSNRAADLLCDEGVPSSQWE